MGRFKYRGRIQNHEKLSQFILIILLNKRPRPIKLMFVTNRATTVKTYLLLHKHSIWIYCWQNYICNVLAIYIYIYIYIIYIYILYIYIYTHIGIGGLLVIHSAAGAKGPGFNSPVARAYFRFNSQASTLAGQQCWLCAVRLHTNCDRIM